VSNERIKRPGFRWRGWDGDVALRASSREHHDTRTSWGWVASVCIHGQKFYGVSLTRKGAISQCRRRLDNFMQAMVCANAVRRGRNA
jgi:hypothetical protein